MKRLPKLSSFVLRCALIVTAVGGATTISHAAALSLRETVQRTLDDNPEIKAAAANRRATEHELRQSQGRLLPNINLDGDYGGEKIDRPEGFAEDVNDVWRKRRQISMTMRQVLFDGWEITNEIYRNAARVDSAALRAMSRSEALALAAIEAFIDVHRQRQVLRVARRNVTRHRRYLRQVQTRKAGGKASIGEVQQVRERLTAAQSALLRIQQSLADAGAKFNRIVGLRPRQLARPPHPRGLPRSHQEAVDLGIRNNPTIRAALADVEAAEHAKNGSRSAYLPKVFAEVKGTRGHDLAGTPGPNEEITGKLVLNWNLFSGGIRTARVNELAERIAESKAVRDSRIRETIEQIDRAFAAVHIGTKRVRSTRERARIALRVVKTYEEEFRLSKRSLLDLLDSESSRFNSDIALIGARSVLLFAKYQILGAVGTLVQHFGATPTNATIADRRESVSRNGALFSIALPPLSK